MEVIRQKATDSEEFRSKQLRARDMLRGELDDKDLDEFVQERVLTTTLEKASDWARGNSFFPLTFGLACCAIEMMTVAASRLDIARFGYEAFRASPRQADLLVLSGRISIKMAYVIAMGACSSSMGVFNNYAIVPADKFMPVDVHVPGCPPRPEALMHGILELRSMVHGDPTLGWRERYEAEGTEEVYPLAPADATGVNVFGAGGTEGTNA